MSELDDLERLALNPSPDWDGKARRKKAPFGWSNSKRPQGQTWTRVGTADPKRADAKLKKF